MGSVTYRFEQFELDPGVGQLCHDRRPIRIGHRAFTLLCYLVEHRDRIVSKKELIDTVWDDAFVSEAALTTTLRTVRLAVGDAGDQQRFIRTVNRRGYQFVAPTSVSQTGSANALVAEATGTPTTAVAVETTAGSRDVVRYCRTADGARIAWAATGTGPPLVKTANWLSGITLERSTTLFTHWFEGLTRGRQLIRYDERGSGLSDPAANFTLDEWMEDLDAVVDAAGLGRFPLLGVSQGGPLAVAYAALRPERVSRLVLDAAYARGGLARARDAVERAEAELDMKLTLTGWNEKNLSYLRFYGAQFFADDPPHRWDEFTSYLSLTTMAANGARLLEEQLRLDVTDLARRVSCPTLIMHSRDDPRIPVSEAIELAELIPDGRLVLFDGRNHLLSAEEPAWPRFLDELSAFLAEEDPNLSWPDHAGSIGCAGG